MESVLVHIKKLTLKTKPKKIAPQKKKAKISLACEMSSKKKKPLNKIIGNIH